MKKQYSFFHYFPKTRDEKIITLTAKKQRNLEALHAEFGKILYGNCPDKNPVFENTLYFGQGSSGAFNDCFQNYFFAIQKTLVRVCFLSVGKDISDRELLDFLQAIAWNAVHYAELMQGRLHFSITKEVAAKLNREITRLQWQEENEDGYTPEGGSDEYDRPGNMDWIRKQSGENSLNLFPFFHPEDCATQEYQTVVRITDKQRTMEEVYAHLKHSLTLICEPYDFDIGKTADAHKMWRDIPDKQLASCFGLLHKGGKGIRLDIHTTGSFTTNKEWLQFMQSAAIAITLYGLPLRLFVSSELITRLDQAIEYLKWLESTDDDYAPDATLWDEHLPPRAKRLLAAKFGRKQT